MGLNTDNYSVLLKKADNNIDIADVAEEKGYLDIAVSRLYYSVLQKMSVFVLDDPDCMTLFHDDKDKGSHEKLYARFIYTVNKRYKGQLSIEAKDAFIDFKALKRKRVKADYEGYHIGRKEFAKEFLVKYERFADALDGLLDGIGAEQI